MIAYQRAVCNDNLGSKDVVTGEAMLPHGQPDPSPQRQTHTLHNTAATSQQILGQQSMAAINLPNPILQGWQSSSPKTALFTQTLGEFTLTIGWFTLTTCPPNH